MKHVATALLLIPALAQGGRILHSSAAVEDNIYTVSVEARINAPAETVLAYITDYERLTAINPSIRESGILQTFSEVRHRVRTVVRACILIFCRDVLQVQDVERLDNTHVVAEIVPALSDFSSGHAEWNLDTAAGQTTLQFTAQVEPSFWVPPIIGPWLYRRMVSSEMLETAAYIEMHATSKGGY